MTNTSTKARDAEGGKGSVGRRWGVVIRVVVKRAERARSASARVRMELEIDQVRLEGGRSRRAEEKGVGRASSAEAFDPLTDGIASCSAKSRAPL